MRPAPDGIAEDLAPLALRMLAEGRSHVPGGLLSSAQADGLLSAGIIADGGVVSHVHCDACDDPHLVAVQAFDDPGEFGWRCPAVGRVTVPRAQVRRWRVDHDRIVTLFAGRAFRPGEFDAAMAADGVWRLGRRDRHDKRFEALLSRDGSDFRALDAWRRALARLAPHHGALILVVSPGGVAPDRPPFATVAPLSAALCSDEAGRVAIDPALCDAVLERAAGASAAGRRSGGRPTEKETTRIIRAALLPSGPIKHGEQSGAARSIRAAWPAYDPDGVAPHASTIVRHLKEQDAEGR